MNLDVICVYCGSREGTDPAFVEGATALGSLLASQGIDIVYGGSTWGMMGAVADAALASGGRVIGVLPRGLASKEKACDRLSELHLVDTMHERKAKMAELSDGFMALPGGMGTLEELCEVTTWAQLGIHQKPVGLCNLSDYFEGFLGFLDHAVAMGFLTAQHRKLIMSAPTPQALVDEMMAFEPFVDKIWLDPSEI